MAENAAEVKGYKTALYVRLSREDERKIESDTVENQIEFLKDYIGRDPSLVLVDEYVDRHVTGTKFDRPEFNRMISDIRGSRINCVVVKDDCVIIEPTQKDLENQGFVAGSICF